MNRSIAYILSGVLLFQLIFPVFGATIDDGIQKTEIVFPYGDEFTTLREIIDEKFSPVVTDTISRYRVDCISGGTLCANYRYTSIDEKALKLILMKTYVGNEDFYQSLYTGISSYIAASELASSGDSLGKLLTNIPKGNSSISLASGFGANRNSSVSTQLLDASFGVDFSSQNNSSILTAIERKIVEIKRNNCYKEESRQDQMVQCPWDGDIDNKYLPTWEVLSEENIFLNGSPVNIGGLADEIEYTLNMGPPISVTETITPSATNNAQAGYKGYINGVLSIDIASVSLAQARESCDINTRNNTSSIVRCTWNDKDINTYPLDVSYTTTRMVPNIIGYTLNYRKDIYTLVEAKNKIDSNDVYITKNTGPNEGVLSIPVTDTMGYRARSEVAAALSNLRDIRTALGAYYADREDYPELIDALDRGYLYKKEILENFKKNFEYTKMNTKDGNASFDIQYIGTIGEGLSEEDYLPQKPDYVALLSGAIVPDIPSIFSYVPADSMVLYVKNPKNLADLLGNQDEQESDLLFDTHKSIEYFIQSYFGIDNITQLAGKLNQEIAIVVTNMDVTAPDIVLILSESDKGVLPETLSDENMFTKGGYVFVSSSRDSLKLVSNLVEGDSLKDAPDFHYVWTKKSKLIKDAFVFVGDAFFEKMLTFENYILHARKYSDYNNLKLLQELVWAYEEAFGNAPKILTEFSDIGLQSITGSILEAYIIEGNIVRHKNIGTLNSINTISDSDYDITKITRNEIDTYKYNILKYREIWSASLDPMGIVVNRYGDGIDIDFFMTPIPDVSDGFIQSLREFFEGTTKETLEFVTNNSIRMGLLSFVGGFDTTKIQEKMLKDPEITAGFTEFSTEILGGKNIFDYIGGEFAFTLGNVDADIFDGWNTEKVDMYLSVQVVNEEKGKELIDIMRTNMLSKNTGTEGSELALLSGFFAKPLIEEYNEKKIYYIDGAEIPYIGKLSIAYTFVDGFFYIGLNRQTMKHIIDISATGDLRKKEIIQAKSLVQNSFFAILFDGVETSSMVKGLYDKNQESIPRYMNAFGLSINTSDSQLTQLLGSYYATQDANVRLGKEVLPFSYILGGLSVSGDISELAVHMDESNISSLTGVLLEEWNTLRNSITFQSGILLESGIPLEEFIVGVSTDTILATNLAIAIQSQFASKASLFKNTVFSLNMGDDEIGFSFRIFEDNGIEDTPTVLDSIIPDDIPKDIVIIAIILVFLGLIGGTSIFLYRKSQSRKDTSTIPTGTENQ